MFLYFSYIAILKGELRSKTKCVRANGVFLEIRSSETPSEIAFAIPEISPSEIKSFFVKGSKSPGCDVNCEKTPTAKL